VEPAISHFREGFPNPTSERVRQLRAALIKRLEGAAPESHRQRTARAWWRPVGFPRDAAVAVGRGANARPRMSVRKRVIALVSAVAVTTGGGVTYFLTQSGRVAELVPVAVGPGFSGVDPGPATRDLMAIFDPSQPPLVSGTITSLEEAASRVPYPLYRPNLGDGTEPEVWITSTNDDSGVTYDAALRYGSILVLTYGRWPSGVDPAESYTRSAAEWKAGYVTTIEGNPAWVVPANDQGPGDPPVSVVHVAIGDVEVTLLGQMSVDELVVAAQTLHA